MRQNYTILKVKVVQSPPKVVHSPTSRLVGGPPPPHARCRRVHVRPRARAGPREHVRIDHFGCKARDLYQKWSSLPITRKCDLPHFLGRIREVKSHFYIFYRIQAVKSATFAKFYWKVRKSSKSGASPLLKSGAFPYCKCGINHILW